MPAFATFVTAAHMRDGIDETAIDQAEARGVEDRARAESIRAVAQQDGRIAAGPAQVLAVDEGHRNLLAGRSSRGDAIEAIRVGPEPARRRIFLAERKRSAPHVEIIRGFLAGAAR